MRDYEHIIAEDPLRDLRSPCPYCRNDIEPAFVVVDGVCHRSLCLAEYWKETNAETLREDDGMTTAVEVWQWVKFLQALSESARDTDALPEDQSDTIDDIAAYLGDYVIDRGDENKED